MREPLRVLSIGAGAIGTYVGGSLALEGHHVVFVERPEVAEGLRSRGFRLDLPEGERRFPGSHVAGRIEDALGGEPFDVALFALKSFDAPVFLDSLAVPPEDLPPFLCLSNGVDNEPAIAAALGAQKVVPGTVTTAVVGKGAGHIELGKHRGMGVARTGHAGRRATVSLSERLVAAMDAAGLRARLFADAADMKWSKLLTNLLANATSAILDLTPAEVFAHPSLYRLEIAQLREALQVMAARGTAVVDLPGIPVRLLAWAVKRLPPALSRPMLRKAVGGGRGNKMPSFHVDLYGGRGKSEVDSLNGAVVREGRRHGIPTPVNALLTEKLLALTRGEIPLETYRKQPEKLVGELG